MFRKYWKKREKTPKQQSTSPWSGFSTMNLKQMRQFYTVYSQDQISQTLSDQFENLPAISTGRKFYLSWSHYLKLMRIDNVDERHFYEIEFVKNDWSLSELKRQYDSSLYEKHNREIVWGDELENMEACIEIRKTDITKLDTDAIVNAANDGLWEGGGVCGAIFREAGSAKLTKACRKIGGCKVGSAVITPGFQLPANYIIHAVGPVWHGGNQNEPELLYSAYRQALLTAKEHGCHSIGFPVISSGIFGYPKEKAWRKAIQACMDFFNENPDCDMKIIFAVLDDGMMQLGQMVLEELASERDSKVK